MNAGKENTEERYDSGTQRGWRNIRRSEWWLKLNMQIRNDDKSASLGRKCFSDMFCIFKVVWFVKTVIGCIMLVCTFPRNTGVQATHFILCCRLKTKYFFGSLSLLLHRKHFTSACWNSWSSACHGATKPVQQAASATRCLLDACARTEVYEGWRDFNAIGGFFMSTGDSSSWRESRRGSF